MTEHEWLACRSSEKMLDFLRGQARRDRKLRLFALACCRRVPAIMAEARLSHAIYLGERYADGLASLEQVLAVVPSILELPIDPFVQFTATATGYVRWHEEEDGGGRSFKGDEYHQLLRGYLAVEATLFASAAVRKEEWKEAECAYLQAQRASLDVAIALDEDWGGHADLLRHIIGNPFRPVAVNPSWLTATVVALARVIYEDRSFDRLPILADALEEAGCKDEEVLTHCRGPGPHLLGCWAVDLLLGKE